MLQNLPSILKYIFNYFKIDAPLGMPHTFVEAVT